LVSIGIILAARIYLTFAGDTWKAFNIKTHQLYQLCPTYKSQLLDQEPSLHDKYAKPVYLPSTPKNATNKRGSSPNPIPNPSLSKHTPPLQNPNQNLEKYSTPFTRPSHHHTFSTNSHSVSDPTQRRYSVSPVPTRRYPFHTVFPPRRRIRPTRADGPSRRVVPRKKTCSRRSLAAAKSARRDVWAVSVAPTRGRVPSPVSVGGN
jgi:hypothetical protein